jgi:hypothetical protein
MFDKLLTADSAIVRKNGDLIKCMDDVIDGFQVGEACISYASSRR